MTDQVKEDTMYCPVCQRNLIASNCIEVKYGEHDSYIFVHDEIAHSEEDMHALENGVQ